MRASERNRNSEPVEELIGAAEPVLHARDALEFLAIALLKSRQTMAMILGKTESAMKSASAVCHENHHEFRVHKGEFVGLVESCGARYRFLVRDLRRERPTIQGTGVDFASAVNTVTQLLNALNGQTVV